MFEHLGADVSYATRLLARLLGSAVPARRAVGVDPVVALRSQ